MADFEVHIDLGGHTQFIGLARTNRGRGNETILFEYGRAWLQAPDRFSLERRLASPAAPLLLLFNCALPAREHV